MHTHKHICMLQLLMEIGSLDLKDCGQGNTGGLGGGWGGEK